MLVILIVGDHMKKILFIFAIFFTFCNNIYADDNLLINDLKITNGEISPKYDKYNNYYSVTIDENTKSLEFSYVYDNNNYEVKIVNNDNLVQNKLVYVTIYNKENSEQNTYIFKVYVNETQSTINYDDSINTLNIETDSKKDINYAPLIGTICFILIIFVYYLIFLR